MNAIIAIFLGMLQGITEFLPISSSGHLLLFEHLLGLGKLEHLLFFNIVCHLGTLGAITLVFWEDVKNLLLFRSPHFKNLFLATLPLVPLVFF